METYEKSNVDTCQKFPSMAANYEKIYLNKSSQKLEEYGVFIAEDVTGY